MLTRSHRDVSPVVRSVLFAVLLCAAVCRTQEYWCDFESTEPRFCGSEATNVTTWLASGKDGQALRFVLGNNSGGSFVSPKIHCASGKNVTGQFLYMAIGVGATLEVSVIPQPTEEKQVIWSKERVVTSGTDLRWATGQFEVPSQPAFQILFTGSGCNECIVALDDVNVTCSSVETDENNIVTAAVGGTVAVAAVVVLVIIFTICSKPRGSWCLCHARARNGRNDGSASQASPPAATSPRMRGHPTAREDPEDNEQVYSYLRRGHSLPLQDAHPTSREFQTLDTVYDRIGRARTLPVPQN